TGLLRARAAATKPPRAAAIGAAGLDARDRAAALQSDQRRERAAASTIERVVLAPVAARDLHIRIRRRLLHLEEPPAPIGPHEPQIVARERLGRALRRA